MHLKYRPLLRFCFHIWICGGQAFTSTGIIYAAVTTALVAVLHERFFWRDTVDIDMARVNYDKAMCDTAIMVTLLMTLSNDIGTL